MGKFRSVTLLYVTARLSLLLSQILFTIIYLTPLLENGCTILVKIALSSFPIGEISMGGIELARVYAIIPARRLLCLCLAILLLSRWAGTIIAEILECRTSSTGFTVDSIVNGLSILYDAVILGVTVYHTRTLVKLRRSLPEMTGCRSLGSLILKQGILRFLIIFCWILQSIITDNLVRPNIRGLTVAVEKPVSVILVLRFFLDLREWNAHPNGTSQTKDLSPCSSWKAVAWKLSHAIIEDLGDPEDEAMFASQATSPGSVSRQVLRATASDAENNDLFPTVNLEEFPWATGRLGGGEIGRGD